MEISIIVLIVAVVVSFVAGAITRNYSHVDRLWSILPAVFVLIWWPQFGSNLRFVIPALLVCAWAVRLTTNFAIKGGYNFSFRRGFYEEDYRWRVLKEKIPNRWLFELFNLTFISSYQLALIFGFTLPLYYLGAIEGPIRNWEWALYVIQGLLLLGETIADIQQWQYYNKRSQPQHAADKRVGLGFNTFGLWKYSRHPNYVCEMGQWLVVSCYLHGALGRFHWSGIAAILLVLLFVGSTQMAEKITSAKYSSYANWKKATPPWLPFLDAPFRVGPRKSFAERFFR